MLTIVVFHSLLIFLEFNKNDIIYNGLFKYVFFTLIQFLRFGNICFFLISGFLFGYKIQTSLNISKDILDYIKRRWLALKTPTILFSAFCGFMGIIVTIGIHIFKNNNMSFFDLIYAFGFNFFQSYTWFIYNLFIGFFIIYLAYSFPKFKTAIYTLSLITAISWGIYPYLNSSNIINHTSTFFGFSFYLLFGFYLGKNSNLFFSIIKTISNFKIIYLITLLSVTVLCIFESLELYEISNISPIFNLKLSTQFQSILFFFGFCIFPQKKLYPSYTHPQTETVGIYFFHTIIINFIYFGSFFILINFFNISSKEAIPIKYLSIILIICPIFSYLSTFIFVRKISHSRYSYLIGIHEK